MIDPAPSGIELRHLRAFVAVAEELNVGRAAARLYLSPPALSRQISALEGLMGCELLRRSTHNVELTLAGEALLDRTRDVLRDVDLAVLAARSVGDELGTRAARLWASVAEASGTLASLEPGRAALEALHAQFSPPAGVVTQAVNAGGVPGLVVTPDAELPLTLMYLHGGGYVAGSAFGYRHLAGGLAAAAETGVLVPDYRLAPEHPFPAAVDDAARAYRWMLARGVAPERLVLAGDSSGCGLLCSLLWRLKADGVPLPGGAVLCTPFVDLAAPGELVALYLDAHPSDDPAVSALTADLSGLPPLLIQAATADPYLDDAQRLHDRARTFGVDARLELYPSAAHAFHCFWTFLPEAADAVHSAGRFAYDVRTRASDVAAES